MKIFQKKGKKNARNRATNYTHIQKDIFKKAVYIMFCNNAGSLQHSMK
jgi:hypothetical protein